MSNIIPTIYWSVLAEFGGISGFDLNLSYLTYDRCLIRGNTKITLTRRWDVPTNIEFNFVNDFEGRIFRGDDY